LRVETFPWLAAQLGGENPQPIFRDRSPDIAVVAHPSLPAELGRTIGKGCGRRILPYRLQDRYGRDRLSGGVPAIVLENEVLKATFLPSLGGRLWSLFHKPLQRELLFTNPVFQPANLALRDAWFAGGIEWNIGQFGHAFHTCAPVFAAAIPGLDGEQGLRLYDYERCKELLWQIDFFLPAGAEFLYAHTRVLNLRNEETRLYWWTNAAIREVPGLRVLAPATESVYVDYSNNGNRLAYGQTQLPTLPTISNKDGTYPENIGFTNEFFYQCQDRQMPWQSALDEHGAGFIEASTQPLNVRKLFCWGMHQGGRRWQEYLCSQGHEYVEVQAGLAPTQQHTVPLAGGGQKAWLQAFGHIQADPEIVHGDNWTTAWQSVDTALKQRLTPDLFARMERICAARVNSKPQEILHCGSGWGALEACRRARHREAGFPPPFEFPESTLGQEQSPWLALLKTGRLPEQSPAQTPGEWMIQPEWHTLLEESLKIPANRQWFALLHLGVMKLEHFDDDGASAAWADSIRSQPSAWAWRNLGALAVRQGALDEALSCYQKAWELASDSGTPDLSFAVEFLSALHAASRIEDGWSFYQRLPSAIQSGDAIRLLAAKIAFARDDLGFVERVLDGEFASIREGARDLSDLWYGLQAKRLAVETGRPYDAGMLQSVKGTLRPPMCVDFRVVQ
jgi:hypothetical protein